MELLMSILGGGLIGAVVGSVIGYLLVIKVLIPHWDRKDAERVTSEDVAKARREWLNAEADYLRELQISFDDRIGVSRKDDPN